MNRAAAESPVGGKGKLILRLLVSLVLVVLMGNLNAVVDMILHPEIPYFDHGHLIVGGVTVLVVLALLGAREVYLVGRRRTEEALTAGEVQYRTILATTMDGFWLTDHEGRFMDVNDAACRHLGYSRKELLGGMRIQDVEAVESAEETAAHIRKIREDGQDRFETRHRRQDGTLVNTEVSVHYTDIGGGGYFTFLRDITERKMAEEALRRLHADLERKVRERTARLQVSNEQLRESQQQQRALLDAIPDLLAWLKDRDGRYVAVNQPFGWACGVDPADVVGKTDLEIWPKALAEAHQADDRLVIESRRIKRTEEPLADGHGQRSWIEMIKAPILDDQGRVIGMVGTARDITERRRAEDALKESEAKYRAIAEEFRALLDAIPDMVFFKDREGRHRFVNRSFERNTGLSQDEVVGKSYEELLPPEVAQQCRRSDGAVYETRDIVRCEEKTTGPDGATILLETIKAPLFDETGEVVGLVGLARDITERKRDEAQLSAYRQQLETLVQERTAALQECDERYRSLVESSLVGFFIVQEGTTVFTNPELMRMFGGSWKECAASDFRCLHPADRDRFLALCDGSLFGSAERPEAVIRQCPEGFADGGGSVRLLHCRATPIKYRGEKAVLVNVLDITRLTEMERITHAQEKMAALGLVATGVAHEIRNPLSGLNISLGVLGKTLEESEGLEPRAREETRAILKMAVAASSKIDGIVRRVMDLANPAPPKMVPISVNACTQETLHLAGVTLRKAGIRLTVALKPELPNVFGDACLLEQVLLNLLTNAAQAMEGREQEKRIEVASDIRDGHVVVSVADSGPGVPEGIREKIFDPFFTRKKEGTGIGLAFSRRVVSDHGGVLTVGTSRFGGALFTIGLPRVDQGGTAAT